MVARCLLFLLVPLVLLADEVKVTAEIEGGVGSAGQPIVGNVIITHKKQQLIDADSFTIEGKPLQVEFVKDVGIPPLILTFYRFTLPPQQPGLYALPSITVKVDGKARTSLRTTYEVEKGASSPPAAPAKPEPPSLKIEAFVKGSSPLYPGQRAELVYTILYSGDIALTKEDLPLLKADGFRKIGDVQAYTQAKGGKSMQTIVQRVETVKPGRFSFPSSLIAGYAFTLDAEGKQVYSKPLISAEAPPVIVEVAPFPEQGKPNSFAGAVGSYTLQTALISPPEVKVGDRVSFAVRIKGEGVLEDIALPDIRCQPGWSGNFEVENPPPAPRIEGDTKTFPLHVRPLSDQINALPPVSFSFFHPETKRYETVASAPIPLKTLPAYPKLPYTGSVKETYSSSKPAVIHGNVFLTSGDLRNALFGTWSALWILPLGGLGLVLEIILRKYLEAHPKVVRQKTSRELLREAEKAPADSSLAFNQIEKALMQRLVEKGEISKPVSVDKLPETGLSEQVKSLLLSVEGGRFGKKPMKKGVEILAQARRLIWVASFWFFSLAGSSNPLELYEAGFSAATLAERETKWNTALSLYEEMEEEHNPVFGNGLLYYDMGNTYFVLGEYPMALLYYYRAEQLMPGNKALLANLEKAEERLNVPPAPRASRFPLPRRIQLFFVLALALFALASAYLWRPSLWIKQAAIFLLLPALFSLANLLYLYYLAPIDAVVVRPTMLYRDAGEGAVVSEEPLRAGERVQVIALSDDGKKGKVIADQEKIGYIPSSSFRLYTAF